MEKFEDAPKPAKAQGIPISLRKDFHIGHSIKQFLSENDSNQYSYLRDINYEPLLGDFSFENGQQTTSKVFTPFRLGQRLIKNPLWISSMTGGSANGQKINQILAKIAHEFNLGMGLGSCRVALEDKSTFKDFDLRNIIGQELPLFANLGIAQIDQILRQKEVFKINELIEDLQADGLMIHLNPLQEWFQAEGDRWQRPPLQIIEEFLDNFKGMVFVKEVGQGMGPRSLEHCLKLPLTGIEFGAFGGTNFSRLELSRLADFNEDNFSAIRQHQTGLTQLGHTAHEMVCSLIKLSQKSSNLKQQIEEKIFIISGGIKDFTHGHSLMEMLRSNTKAKCLYAQAGALVYYADRSEQELRDYVGSQIKGFKLMEQFTDGFKD